MTIFYQLFLIDINIFLIGTIDAWLRTIPDEWSLHGRQRIELDAAGGQAD
jgi:hypothetical protein